MLFNIFLNDLFLYIKNSGFYNFADDNAIITTCKFLTELLPTLEQESESAVKWLKQNKLIANANKCQAIPLSEKSEADCKLAIENNNIESTKYAKLLGITRTRLRIS